MAANAPYYQMRAGQFINATNTANAAPSQFVPDDDEYDLSAAAAVASPSDHLHPSMYSEHSARPASTDNTFEESHNLAELLEAATTAQNAGQATNVDDSIGSSDNSKRKRVLSSPSDDASPSYEAIETCGAKRRRFHLSSNPYLQDDGRNLRGEFEQVNMSHSSESLLHEARAAGVHSAAALFRRSSEKACRKYTRPPMSKLFMSLQLSPENFLQLQAQAKSYMLDKAHPDRQTCVGNRGKGDTDMVKLRLFNCVRDFLSSGIGEQFFGEHVEKPGASEAIEAARALGEEKIHSVEQKLVWPRDGNRIIGLVTPLMRRMVTNERQRQYAIETRKGGDKKKDKEGSVESAIHPGDNTSALDPDLDRTRLSQPPSPTTLMNVMTKLSSPPGTYRTHPEYNQTAFQAAKTSDPTSFKLPVYGTAELNLSHINIFLTLAPRGPAPSINLEVTRIGLQAPQKHLAWYEWDAFLEHVVDLLQRAKSKYPEINDSLVVQENSLGAENLRGLAAAANALSNDNADANANANANGEQPSTHFQPDVQNSTPTSPSPSPSPAPSTALHTSICVPSASPSSPKPASQSPSRSNNNNTITTNTTTTTTTTLLPRCTIKSIGPEGWKTITNAKDWYAMLLEKAFAVWADGVCNVIVELADLSSSSPVPGMEAVEGR